MKSCIAADGLETLVDPGEVILCLPQKVAELELHMSRASGDLKHYFEDGRFSEVLKRLKGRLRNLAIERQPPYLTFQSLAVEVDSLFQAVRFYRRASEDFVKASTKGEQQTLVDIEALLDQMQREIFRCKTYLRELHAQIP